MRVRNAKPAQNPKIGVSVEDFGGFVDDGKIVHPAGISGIGCGEPVGEGEKAIVAVRSVERPVSLRSG